MLGKRMVGTVYVISDLIGTGSYWSTSELREAYTNGWDIGNHTKDHTDLTTLTQVQAAAELTDCKTVLDGLGFTRASSHVAYPGGLKNDTVLAAMNDAGMLSGRTVNSASTNAPANRLVMPTIEWRCKPTFSIDFTISLATVKTYVDRAIARGEVLTLLFHQLVAAGPGASQWLISDFQSLIDYIEARKVTTLTASEIYALQSDSLWINHK